MEVINMDKYQPAYFNAIAKQVNEHADSFTIDIPKSLNCRLLNLQRTNKTHQFYYKEKTYYIKNLADLESFIEEEFPKLKIIEHQEENDDDEEGMLIIMNSKPNNDTDYLTFYHSDDSKGVFSCYFEEGGSRTPFRKLLNIIGMEATE
jgi:hypothetical protein